MERLKQVLGLKSWQERMIEGIDKELQRGKQKILASIGEKITEMEKTAEIKKRIVRELREEPAWMFGGTSILVRTENHLLAHDVVRALGIKLKREAEDSFHYRGVFEGIDITVYGAGVVLGCRIVPKKVTKVVTEYEVVCE